MSERQKMLGQHVELRQERAKNARACEALRDSLRSLLPVAGDISTVDRDTMLDTAAALHGALADLEVKDKGLAILRRELGI